MFGGDEGGRKTDSRHRGEEVRFREVRVHDVRVHPPDDSAQIRHSPVGGLVDIEGENGDVEATELIQQGAFGRRDDEFAVVRAGLNYKFGSY